jgi:probable lipoprotein NlpC
MNLAPSPGFTKYGKYIGVPYADRGRDMTGWDCFGLYCYVLAEVMGKQVRSYDHTYQTADSREQVASAIRMHAGEWQRVALGDEREGDGVVFLLGGQPLHCGYVLAPGTMLHCLKGRETCIERYDSFAWNRRIEGIYKWN